MSPDSRTDQHVIDCYLLFEELNTLQHELKGRSMTWFKERYSHFKLVDNLKTRVLTFCPIFGEFAIEERLLKLVLSLHGSVLQANGDPQRTEEQPYGIPDKMVPERWDVVGLGQAMVNTFLVQYCLCAFPSFRISS